MMEVTRVKCGAGTAIHFLLVFLLITSTFLPIGPSLSSVLLPTSQHRHRLHRQNRSATSDPSDPSESPVVDGRSSRRPNSLFPTTAPPIDFRFTAPSYNLSVYENSIGPRAVASNPKNAQMVGVWLPRGYNQITFRIVGDQRDRFAASAKRLGNFAFLQLEHRDQMDVLNRELQSEFTFSIQATAKRKRGHTLEASATVHIRVLDENDNPPMFKELAYRLEVDEHVSLNQRLLRVEGFDADEGLNGALCYSLIAPSSFFYIEPMTGWLCNFAPLSGDIPNNELQLEVQIEDRASRLFRHTQRSADTAEPMASIRNKAKVQIVIRRKAVEKPKLTFRLLPFGPFLSAPTRVGTVRIGHSDPNSILLDISRRQNSSNVANCAWLERTNAEEVDLWVCAPFPEKEYGEKLHIRLAIYRIPEKMQRKRQQMGEEIVEVWADPLKRDLRLEEVPKVAEVNESLPVGALVWHFNAMTSWPKDRSGIIFKLYQPNNGTEFPFQLNHRTGRLRLAKSLKSERRAKVRHWNITVEVQHAHIQSSSAAATARLQLRLRDANTHCPTFVEVPICHCIELPERQRNPKTVSDRIIWRANASDDDEGENGRVVYELAGDERGLFDIDPSSGEIRLIGNWSASSASAHRQQIVRVIASDRGWPFRLQTQLQLAIHYTAIVRPNSSDSSLSLPNSEWLQSVCQKENKNQPKFVGEQHFLGEVLETAPIGTTVGTVVAEDGDSFGPNGAVQYFMGGDSETHFDVEPSSGRVFVRTGRLGDLLQGAKGRNDGHDFYEHVLDIAAFDMAIRDEQRKSVHQQFRVRVRAENTHSPVFDQPGYRISFAEGNSPSIELLQLRATDDDLGKNGQVEFRLVPETDFFSVDPDSGLVRAERTLDREELGDRVTVQAMALDRGTPPRATFANLTIFLIDQNDNSPQCGRDSHRFTISEDAPNEQLVGCMDAYDLDEFGTLNSQIRFELAPSSDDVQVPFRVHAESGCIFVALPSGLPLDFEQRSAYNFSVRLKDMGKPSLEANAPCQVQILLEDVDENVSPPQFAELAIETSVEENAPPRTEVIRVQAEDAQGTVVQYRLVAGSGIDCFQIDPRSGVISTQWELDHELRPHYWLTVRADDTPSSPDGRTLHSHLQVFVRILNKNDRLPLFSQPIYRIGVAENAEENKVVLKVEATDGDDQWARPSQQSERLRYSILRGNPQSYFQMDEHSGYIVTGKRRLDREAQSEHELIIQACDQGHLCSTATVLVTVDDLNDNAPAFDARHFAPMAIPADRQGLVGRVIASDSDIVGSKLRFWMDGGDEMVQMDNGGRLFVKEPLSAGSELAAATVWAEDGGVPPLRANATILLVALGRVGRLRTSNRPPHLLEGSEWRRMEVATDASPGTVVGVVRAEDEDGDPLWWTITSTTLVDGETEQRQEGETEYEPFAFRRVDAGAELVVVEPLLTADDRLTQSHLLVRFALTDGVDTINDQIRVRIRNLSLSKLRPKFDQSLATVELGSDLPVGFVLFQVNAQKLPEHSEQIDRLAHPQSLHYSLHSFDDVAATDVFRVDPSTGNVILERPLPERLASPFTLTISATLFGSSDASDFAFLRMQRKSPECGQSLYQAQLLENDPFGLDIQLEAHDRYALGPAPTNGSPHLFFTLSKETPVELAQRLAVSPADRIRLRANTSLDFEYWKNAKGAQKRGASTLLLEFNVQVNSDEPIPRTAFCRVQIALLDVNDNGPVFEQSFYEVEVSENAQNGTKILKLFAEDADSGHFGRVSYAIDSVELIEDKSGQNESLADVSDLSAHFLLGDQDGWLKIGTQLDFERIGKDRFIQLIISARDGGEPPRYNQTKVRVKVLDENDNAPQIGACSELSVLAQEEITPGNALLSLSISDADSAEGNGGPFRVEVEGDGADAFTVDSLLNLVATRHLTFVDEHEFHLQLRAFDVAGLPSAPCQVRIRVQPKSRHAPEVRPLFVHLMALHGEFLGGSLGKVVASDQDSTDQLRFSISEQNQPQFSINSKSGELFASGDLLSGMFRLNVSVTDGKFVTNAPTTVNVIKVDHEKMDNSLTIRLRGIGAGQFVNDFMHRFTEIVAALLSVKTNGVFILSLQETHLPMHQNELKTDDGQTLGARHAIRRRRNDKGIGGNDGRREGTANSLLDIILAVQRIDATAGGMLYHRPNYVKQRLETGIGQLEKEMTGLKVLSLVTEVCRRDTCMRGECRDRLWMDNSKVDTFQPLGSATVFIGPLHIRSFECICRQGFVGAKCDIPANKCSKELCKRVELCIPSSVHSPFPPNNVGFSCACSPGFRGPTCSERICNNAIASSSSSADQCHRHHEAIALFGGGYFELRLALSVESRMELSVDFRTVSPQAVLMFGKGFYDYQMLRIEDGIIQYSWNSGTGDGVVKIVAMRVDNGQWHQIRILRIGRLSRLTLDDKFRAEGTSPTGSDVLNLFLHATVLLFGARVEPSALSRRQFFEAFNATTNQKRLTEEEETKLAFTADDLRVQLTDGMVGCIGRIAMDGTELPKTGQGFRMFNGAIGCDERALGPCLSAPCQNGAHCVPSVPSPAGDFLHSTTNHSAPLFTCLCLPRFTGARCEIDLNACASKPCPNGIPCHNLYGDFHCSCPPGFTGKTCQLRGDWDPCVTASCGRNGQCVRQTHGNSFICQCSDGFSGPLCTDSVPTKLAPPADGGRGERNDDDAGGPSEGADFLWEAISAPQLALLVALCLLSLLCTALGVIFCQMKRQSEETSGGNNRRKKMGKGRRETGERPRNGTSGGTVHHHSMGTTSGNRRCRRDGDAASNPLVPKETAAPGQGTADRPPPPLPPRYHRRSANGQNNALPTVEVRPMPIGERRSAAGSTMEGSSELAKTPPLPPPRESSETQNDYAINSVGHTQQQVVGKNSQNGQSESYGRKIDRACSAAADTQKQKAISKKGTANKTTRNGGRNGDAKKEGAKEEGKSDYLTMKPVYRAKPFRLVSKASGAWATENPPPPPLHRTPLLNSRITTGGQAVQRNDTLYDSPTDALDAEEGEEEENGGRGESGRGTRGGGEEQQPMMSEDSSD